VVHGFSKVGALLVWVADDLRRGAAAWDGARLVVAPRVVGEAVEIADYDVEFVLFDEDESGAAL
jgi:hypothetical protein